MDVRIDRRRFAETLLILPIGTFLLRCGSSSSGTAGPASTPQVSGGEAVYTSSEVSSHVHTFGIRLADFASPPSTGVSGDTSNNAGHTHSVSVSMADLQKVQMGGTVTAMTSLNSGHTHVFSFTKVAGQAAADGG